MANRSLSLQGPLNQLQEELSGRGLPLIILESFFLGSISLVSFIGNVIILIAFYRCIRLRTVTNVLVLSLSICNVLTALILVPISTGVLATSKMYMGALGCQIFGSFSVLLENVTFQTVCVMAINRLVVIAKPKWYAVLFSFKSTFSTVASSWVIQLIYVLLPTLANWSEPLLSPGYTTCALLVTEPLAKQFYRAQKELVFMGGLTVILICYIIVYIKMKRRRRVLPIRQRTSESYENDQEKQSAQDGPRRQSAMSHDATSKPHSLQSVPNIATNECLSQGSISENDGSGLLSQQSLPNSNKISSWQPVAETPTLEHSMANHMPHVEINRLSLESVLGDYKTEGLFQHAWPRNDTTDKQSSQRTMLKNETVECHSQRTAPECATTEYTFPETLPDSPALQCQSEQFVRNQATTDCLNKQSTIDNATTKLPQEFELDKISIDCVSPESLPDYAAFRCQFQQSLRNDVTTLFGTTQRRSIQENTNRKCTSQQFNQTSSIPEIQSQQSIPEYPINECISEQSRQSLAVSLPEHATIENSSSTANTRSLSDELVPNSTIYYLKQEKTTKLLFYITLCFLVSWIPLSVIIIVESYQSKFTSRQVQLFGITLLFLGTAFNPVLLPSLNRDFRQQFFRILRFRN